LRASPGTTTTLHKAVAIEQRMEGTVGRNFNPRKSANQTLTNLSSTPRWCARASRSKCSSLLERAACVRSDGAAGFCRSAPECRIPDSGRRSCNRSYGRCRTPCKVPPSPRRRATNCSLSSITEHSFQDITPSLSVESVPMCPVRCVTYVSGRSRPHAVSLTRVQERRPMS